MTLLLILLLMDLVLLLSSTISDIPAGWLVDIFGQRLCLSSIASIIPCSCIIACFIN